MGMYVGPCKCSDCNFVILDFEMYQTQVETEVCENFMRICDGVDYHAKLNIDMEKGEIYMFVIRRSGKGDLERKEAIRKVLC